MMKPCPFCGSQKLSLARFIGKYWMHAVRCDSCLAEGPNVYENRHLSIENAENMAQVEWDTRS